MSVNNYRPHLKVLCEDKINQDMVRGFVMGIFNVSQRIEIIQDVAGGCHKAKVLLENIWIEKLLKYPTMFLLIIIDFDKDINRITYMRENIPEELKDRVFILGCFDEPEKFKQYAREKIGSKKGIPSESIGKVLFLECKDDNLELWQSEHLKHNLQEIERLKRACDFINWNFS